jgi:uncharacterized membrane protein
MKDKKTGLSEDAFDGFRVAWWMNFASDDMNDSQSIDRSSRIMITIAIHVFLYVVVFLDVPVARQVICFLYLTFVPGSVIMNLLGVRRFDSLQNVLFSVGLSIAFLMLVGSVLNWFGPLVGFSQPLLVEPLIIVIGGVTLLLASLSFVMNKSIELPFPKNSKTLLLVLPLIIPLVLSIIGAYLVNTSGNSSVLLLMIIAVLVISVASIASQRGSLSKFYAITLLIVGVALLFHSTLVSNYIHGADLHLEYYVFRSTQINAHWDPNLFSGTTWRDLDNSRYNSMLSLTVLPTIYSNLLDLDATWILKIVFPLIFSFVPLGLYALFQIYFEKRIAFVSALLVVFETDFLVITTLAREMIAELFFALLFIVLLNKKIKPTVQSVCFVLFSFALVTTHYSMALIFGFLVFSSWLLILLWKKRTSRVLKPTLLMLFFSIMFLWYIYTSWSAPFNSFTLFLKYNYASLRDFFVLSSRGSEVLRGIGLEQASSLLQALSRYVAYAVEALIIIGVIAVVTKKTKRKLDDEFVALILFTVGILAMCILLPQFALSLQMDRFFHISLLLLAPMFLLGCEAFVTLILKRKTKVLTILILVILIPYFLFQSNFVYAVTGYKSWSVPLSISSMGVRPYTTEFCYVQEEDVYGATWLHNNLNDNTSRIYADAASVFDVLTSYGMIQRDIGGRVEIITNATSLVSNGTVFLSKMNLIDGIYETADGSTASINVSQLQVFTNTIYSNGFSEICKKP